MSTSKPNEISVILNRGFPDDPLMRESSMRTHRYAAIERIGAMLRAIGDENAAAAYEAALAMPYGWKVRSARSDE